MFFPQRELKAVLLLSLVQDGADFSCIKVGMDML